MGFIGGRRNNLPLPRTTGEVEESLPLPHRLCPHRLRNLLDIRHLEHARGDQHDLAAADQVAAAEAEVDGAACDACGAFQPLAELRAAHELRAERHRRMRPADAGGMARAHAHHHVGHGHQQAAMRPAHGVAMTRLERQADPELLALDLEPERADQPDEAVGHIELAETFGDQRIGHEPSPSLEAANFSSAARTAGSNAMLRCVSSFSETMIAFSTAVQLPSPSNSPWPITHLRSCTSRRRAQAVARPGKNIWRLKSISSRPTTTRKRGSPPFFKDCRTITRM